MSQQINLLDESLRPKQDWLCLRNVVFAAVAVVGALIAVGGLAGLKAGQEQARFRNVEQQLKRAQEQLAELATEQGRRRIDASLEAELAKTRQSLQDRQEIMSVLERGDLGDRTGFARYMRGFAKQALDGVWMTGFDLTAAGRTMEIRGRMRQESLLPSYVRQLNQEPVFQGRRFAALDMARVDPAKPRSDGAAQAVKESPPGQPFVEFVLAGEPAKAGQPAP